MPKAAQNWEIAGGNKSGRRLTTRDHNGEQTMEELKITDDYVLDKDI